MCCYEYSRRRDIQDVETIQDGRGQRASSILKERVTCFLPWLARSESQERSRRLGHDLRCEAYLGVGE